MKLPKQYQWLREIGTLPKMVNHGLKLYGVEEKPKDQNSKIILDWAKEVGLEKVYTADSIPWCGLFMAVVAKRSGYEFPKEPLWALNWRTFGTPKSQPELGDVLVFVREGGGHVGIYIAEDGSHYHVLGGNQGNKVSIVRIAISRLRSCRQPNYRVAKPASSKPYLVLPMGSISTNER